MSISLYDLLDVDETASADDIKAAWKSAIADLDPTDRRFRAYNDAAAVLLDGDKRAAYDAELAAARVDEEPASDSSWAPESEPAAPAEPVITVAPPTLEPTAAPAPEPAPVAEVADTEKAAASSGVPTWSLFLAGALAVISAALLVVVLVWSGGSLFGGDDSPAKVADEASTSEDAGRAAEAAADEAVPVVLSYDYRTLEQNFNEASKYLTDDFAQKRSELFDQKADGGSTLRDQIVADKVVVTAISSATGLTRVSTAGDRATVVVYVDQESQKGKSAPRTLKMWATLDMVNDDGDWLIDNICTESDCS